MPSATYDLQITPVSGSALKGPDLLQHVARIEFNESMDLISEFSLSLTVPANSLRTKVLAAVKVGAAFQLTLKWNRTGSEQTRVIKGDITRVGYQWSAESPMSLSVVGHN